MQRMGAGGLPHGGLHICRLVNLCVSMCMLCVCVCLCVCIPGTQWSTHTPACRGSLPRGANGPALQCHAGQL